MSRVKTFIFAAMLAFFMPFVATTQAEEQIDPLAGVHVDTVGSLGYDLVELFPGGASNPNEGELVMGNVRYRSEYEHVTFLFANEDNLARFKENPNRYLPGAGGYCLLGLHHRAVDTASGEEFSMPPPGDPAARTFANGRWYFHAGIGAEKAFEKDPDTIDERTADAVAFFNSLLKKQVASE